MCELKDAGGLGFRDLAKFNIVLLAKKGWRLLANLCSLVRRFLKVKYFPTTGFLQARLGSQPSLVWKSIWIARGLLDQV